MFARMVFQNKLVCVFSLWVFSAGVHDVSATQHTGKILQVGIVEQPFNVSHTLRLSLNDDSGTQKIARNFSWTLPSLQDALWADSYSDGKSLTVLETTKAIGDGAAHGVIRQRADNPIKWDPMQEALIANSCKNCQDAGQDIVYPTLKLSNSFLSSTHLGVAIKTEAKSQRCVFYSQRPSGSSPPSLSDDVQDWVKAMGCDKYRSIWDLWPRRQLKDPKPPDCVQPFSDFYCFSLYKPRCCWLNGLWNGLNKNQIEMKKVQTRYFERMSKAFALDCKGWAYIISELDIDDLIRDPNSENQRSIWFSHELPTLVRLYNQKPRRIIEGLRLIRMDQAGKIEKNEGNFVDITKQVLEGASGLLPLDQQEPRRRVGQEDWDFEDLRAIAESRAHWLQQEQQTAHHDVNATELLVKRGSQCNPGAREPANEDWFG